MTDDERDALIRSTAKSSANTLLLLDKLASGLREDLGQVFGALLTIDGAMNQPKTSTAAPAPAETPKNGVPAKSEHTGRHDLIGGISVEVPEDTARRAITTWAVLRGLWYVAVTIAGGAGWLLHLWRK